MGVMSTQRDNPKPPEGAQDEPPEVESVGGQPENQRFSTGLTYRSSVLHVLNKPFETKQRKADCKWFGDLTPIRHTNGTFRPGPGRGDLPHTQKAKAVT